MEPLRGGASRFRDQQNHRSPPSAGKFLSLLETQSSSTTSSLELSEDDIFNTLPVAVDSSSPSPTHSYSNRHLIHTRNNINRNNHGILAALNGNSKARSGSGALPVFNHKASGTASISSSSSTSPAASISSRILIPRPPPPHPDKASVHHQSAPVNVPVIPNALQRRARVWEDDTVPDEEEDEDNNGMITPPHEVVAGRHSPKLAYSVLEGAGRTLKGRDLRQVRNAIWRQTGFID